MVLEDKDVDPLGDRPITSGTARDVLSNPRWAYLLFELDIINNQESAQTADGLADRLQLSPETVSEDLDALEKKDAVRVTSESPSRYQSEGCYFFADNWVELPDRERVEYIPKSMFGAIGYGYIDPTVNQFIEEYGYEKCYGAASIYRATVLGDEYDYSFEEMFPKIPNRDIGPIKRAYRYAYSRLSEDPLRRETYDIEYTVEE